MTIKRRYINNCRRPFEILYILTIVSMLLYAIFYFKWSLLSLMMFICTVAHITELVHEKKLQNDLIDINLS